MEYLVYITSLYDIYKELLTKKQQEYFEEYYIENLTLQEISDNKKVSRNAVFGQLKEVETKLKNYEKILKCLEKKQAILKVIEKLDSQIKTKIEKIME